MVSTKANTMARTAVFRAVMVSFSKVFSCTVQQNGDGHRSRLAKKAKGKVGPRFTCK